MNSVHLMGNLTRDPETRFTPSGKSVTEASIAVSKRWKTESGEQKEQTAFVSLVIWGAKGEAFAKFHRKGSRALVSGELVQDTWDDKETGKKREKTRVNVLDWYFTAPKQGGDAADAATPARPAAARATTPKAESADQNPEYDDVPF